MKATIFTVNLLFFCFLICGVQAQVALAQDNSSPRLIAMAEKDMHFFAAKDFCARLGGRLPRVVANGRPVTSWPLKNINSISALESFRHKGGGQRLCTPFCWTATEVSDLPGSSWFAIISANLEVRFADSDQGKEYEVICVK